MNEYGTVMRVGRNISRGHRRPHPNVAGRSIPKILGPYLTLKGFDVGPRNLLQ